MKAKKSASKIIATRKACKADGIGLSHFVLMDKESAKPKPKAAKQ